MSRAPHADRPALPLLLCLPLLFGLGGCCVPTTDDTPKDTPTDTDPDTDTDTDPDTDTDTVDVVEVDTAAVDPNDGKVSDALREAIARDGKAEAMIEIAGEYEPIAAPIGDERVVAEIQRARRKQESALRGAQNAIARIVPPDATWPGVPYMPVTIDATQLNSLAALSETAYIDLADEGGHLVQARPDCAPADACDGDPRLDVGASAFATAGFDGTGWNVVVVDSGFRDDGVLAGRITDSACFTDGECHCSGNVAATASCTATSPKNASCFGGSGECGHGTNVASIVTNDSNKAPGVAPGAKLLPIRVFGEGQGDFRLQDLVSALDHVVTNWSPSYPIASVNLSIVLTDNKGKVKLFDNQKQCRDWKNGTKALYWKVEELRLAGIPVVVAAGNNGSPKRLASPACFDNVVSVGGATPEVQNCCVWAQSNIAPYLTLLAPAHCVPVPLAGEPDDAFYPSGTSLAAPHVAAAYALLRDQDPSLGLTDLTQELVATSSVCTDDTRAEITPARTGKLIKPVP